MSQNGQTHFKNLAANADMSLIDPFLSLLSSEGLCLWKKLMNSINFTKNRILWAYWKKNYWKKYRKL